MKKFIIYKHADNMLVNCILDVIEYNDEYVTLSFNDFDKSVNTTVVPIADGEFYTKDVIKRRKKDLAIRNVLSLMEYNNLTLEDLK